MEVEHSDAHDDGTWVEFSGTRISTREAVLLRGWLYQIGADAVVRLNAGRKIVVAKRSLVTLIARAVRAQCSEEVWKRLTKVKFASEIKDLSLIHI